MPIIGNKLYVQDEDDYDQRRCPTNSFLAKSGIWITRVTGKYLYFFHSDYLGEIEKLNWDKSLIYVGLERLFVYSGERPEYDEDCQSYLELDNGIMVRLYDKEGTFFLLDNGHKVFAFKTEICPQDTESNPEM